jgi:hypothetical protein
MKFCQVENPYEQDGTRITVSPQDCAKAAKDLGSECSCGKIAFVGWDWDKAADNIWDTSSINAQVLAEYMGAGGKPAQMKTQSRDLTGELAGTQVASRVQAKARAASGGSAALPADKTAPYHPLSRTDRYTLNLQGLTDHLAYAGRDGSNKAPATVVDRQGVGAPTWGMDPAGRDVIPEWDKQDDAYSFWGREGGWRNICGARQHPMWDPQQKRFYTYKAGQASNYKKHWCSCFPSGNVEIETKQGADTMGCEDMYETGSNIKSATVAPGGDERRMGRGAETYETTAPGYKYQRVMDRHDDVRWDERYPSFVSGNGGDRGIWMDENDGGPAAVIDDYAKGKLWAPKRQELMHPSLQGALPLNRLELPPATPADRILPWDTPRASGVREERRGYIKAKSGDASGKPSLRLWPSDVDVLGLERKAGSNVRQKKVIVDAWGHPLTHRPTSADYPMVLPRRVPRTRRCAQLHLFG